MGAINLNIRFFTETDGSASSIEQRIEEAMNMIMTKEDYIFIDNTSCSNEEELKQYLSKKGIL